MQAEPRLVVSTQCPSCGAPLDFGEGTNSVACGYCRSTALVTGRGRTLAYTVTPRVAPRDAFAAARFAEPSQEGTYRVLEPRLVFLPYYRFRAIELRWARPAPAPRPFLPPPPDSSSDYRPAISLEQALADLQPDPDEVELDERHVEKSFLALAAPGIELYSLGLRAGALELSLFGRHALASRGAVVAPEMSPAEAIERGERLAQRSEVAARRLLARRLSLVYFPFWFVPVRRAGAKTTTVIDAVTASVVLRGADERRFAHFRAATDDEQTLGFRPLVCPNCGWALPPRADDFVFYCTTCSHAWKILGEELLEVPHRIVGRPRRASHGVRYLPLWELAGSIGESPPRRFLAPAFRYRRLKTLAELTARLTRYDRPLESAERDTHEVHGAFFDEDDAAALVAFAAIAAAEDRFDEVEARRDVRVDVHTAALVWAPFAVDAYAFVDPFLGASLPKNLLL